ARRPGPRPRRARPVRRRPRGAALGPPAPAGRRGQPAACHRGRVGRARCRDHRRYGGLVMVREGVVPWPEEFAARYVAAGYWQGRALGELLREAAEANPDAVALVDGPLRLTHAELA